VASIYLILIRIQARHNKQLNLEKLYHSLQDNERPQRGQRLGPQSQRGRRLHNDFGDYLETHLRYV